MRDSYFEYLEEYITGVLGYLVGMVFSMGFMLFVLGWETEFIGIYFFGGLAFVLVFGVLGYLVFFFKTFEIVRRE